MAKTSQTLLNPSIMYVTYTKKNLNGTRSRFAVECQTKEQAQEIACDLNARPGVINVRLNTSGRNLPDEAHTFTYHEYKSQK